MLCISVNEIIQQPQQTNQEDNSLASQQSNAQLTTQLVKQIVATKQAECQKNTERMRQMGGVNDLGPSQCTPNPLHLRGEELGVNGSRANTISNNFFRKQLSQPLQASNQQSIMVTTSLGNQVAPVSIVQSSEPRVSCLFCHQHYFSIFKYFIYTNLISFQINSQGVNLYRRESKVLTVYCRGSYQNEICT